MTLDGQVVIVTGGSRGIGRSCVLQALALDARVIFCSRHDEAGRREVESDAASRGCGGRVVGVQADISREDDVARLFETARRTFGSVTSVVSNAATSVASLLVTMETADWDQVMATNLTGSFLVARAALRAFREQGTGGRLVLLGTLSQNGAAGNCAYAASKGGVLGLMRLIARDYGVHGIRANLVAPGYVATTLSSSLSESQTRRLVEQCPLERSGSPDEIASVITFLLSDEAAGLNGQAIFASGGLRETPA